MFLNKLKLYTWRICPEDKHAQKNSVCLGKGCLSASCSSCTSNSLRVSAWQAGTHCGQRWGGGGGLLCLSGPQMLLNPEQPLIWWVTWRLSLSLIPSFCPGQRGGPAEWPVAAAAHPRVCSQGHKRSEVRHRGPIAGLYFQTAHCAQDVVWEPFRNVYMST